MRSQGSFCVFLAQEACQGVEGIRVLVQNPDESVLFKGPDDGSCCTVNINPISAEPLVYC